MASKSSYAIAGVDSPITANGQYPDTGIPWQGGTGSVQVYGTFGGGTAKLQLLADDGSTKLDLGSDVSFTASGVGGFLAPAGTLFLTLSGATNPSVKASVAQIG